MLSVGILLALAAPAGAWQRMEGLDDLLRQSNRRQQEREESRFHEQLLLELQHQRYSQERAERQRDLEMLQNRILRPALEDLR
jgi:hypothetical protein